MKSTCEHVTQHEPDVIQETSWVSDLIQCSSDLGIEYYFSSVLNKSHSVKQLAEILQCKS